MNPVKTIKNAQSAHEICLSLNEIDRTNRSLHYYKITAQNAFFKSQQRVEIVAGLTQQDAVNDFLNRIGRVFNVIEVLQIA